MSTFQYYTQRENDGYTVYDLSTDPDHNWGIAILDISHTSTHFHKIGIEHFTVLEGTIEIILDENVHILGAGESITIPVGVRHSFKSLTGKPARLLCLNMPAFDPNDMFVE